MVKDKNDERYVLLPGATGDGIGFQHSKGQLSGSHRPTSRSSSSAIDPHITEAYRQFEHRLSMQYKVCDTPEDRSVTEIEKLLGMIPGNSTQLGLDMRKWAYYASIPFCCVCFPYMLCYTRRAQFTVPNNHFALVEDQSGDKPETKLYGPGYHDLGFYRYVREIHTFQRKVANNLIKAPLGDLFIITVDQGTIALFEYNGQFKIFGPGLHMIRDTMQFRSIFKLDSFYIKVGPEKWITIPDQYDGIALNNGKTVILEGGKQHHLWHENYKFAKLVPKIILTDRVVTDVCKYIHNLTKARGELPVMQSNELDPAIYLQTKTKDGAVIYLDAMLFWEIIDTALSAHKAMNVMELRKAIAEPGEEDEQFHISSASRNIDNLRKTVLRFAKSCLAEEVGHVCLTDDELFFRDKFSGETPSGKPKGKASLARPPLQQSGGSQENMSVATMNFAIQNFLNNQTEDLVARLNDDLLGYGVRVSKLTINNALPMPEVQDQLDKQAKAKIDRNTALVIAETQRSVAEESMRTDRVNRLGQAHNKLEAAKINKDTAITEAEAMAERERIIARGRKDAAEMQESTALGKQLAMMEAISEASKSFNSGNGEKVYIVGSPMEALTKVAGRMFPGIAQV